MITRIKSFGFELPGGRRQLSELPLSVSEHKRLRSSGQEFFHTSDGRGSTALMVLAARKAIENAEIDASQIALVISAPSLITSHSLDIPAVAVRAKLGLLNAQCIALQQGCAGIFRAISLGAQHLAAHPDQGDVLVTTACVASAVTRNQTHGPFFWGDGAGALVLTSEPGGGLLCSGYAERSLDRNWGAMRIGFGDAKPYADCGPDDFLIDVNFPSAEELADYISGEGQRFRDIVDELLTRWELTAHDLKAVILPSIGKNRFRTFFGDREELRERLVSETSYAHMGGVDTMLFLHNILQNAMGSCDGWYIAATPSLTAQWAGMLFHHVSAPVSRQ